ncbi:MAG: Rpp14/Pop5 family protein [Methanosarcina thermophila]|uniref:Ribonuclease P protein component 2 n=3 Tax=Methanosarcina thermophila TaxID=2210 RepID=A0A1I6Z163_METTE|nr:Rpp14/Pop5 family protein [Methanosarcina thermophila]ALK06312.1 MAG: ribonuclease P [Methanosarcina sp. 795]AKB12073.1 Ribonuclease P protein component 2 [Methanosarcina thermophila TM-1]AKB14726.1 Ribonuclease P protein component 2 [Methanosarcina thermophila CHTI-55]NLU57381.1 ribonuclease P [Methanosarcina thermophila]SFT56475.1 ribonuclease P protein subunit Rpp14 [Methanosarcina thermophila]
MKRLLPSLRAKKRYLAFELVSEGQVSRSDLVKEVMSSASSLLGDVTASECDIRVLGFEDCKGIIQCSHTKVKETRASLATLTRVGGKRATLHVLGISGTIKKATEKFLQNHTVFKPEIRMKSRKVEE